MPYRGLSEFIAELDRRNEIVKIKHFVNPVLEITEVTDRIVKSGGKALLFENTGTQFPLLINCYGSDSRMALSIGRTDLDDTGREISALFGLLSATHGGLLKKISSLPSILRLAGYLPSKISSRGSCQDVIMREPDLSVFPVLKCWPYDGGRYITLPVVHTIHPETGSTNAGMYRMQILDRNTTGMHWQRHKTGAGHFAEWKKAGKRMPVSVSLGGDPVYAYSATAPLPEGIDEYILAGFLRKKKVRLVKCLTNDLYVPEDSDIVIEGYVDPGEELLMEGPFGDHTGYYSLDDLYPRFHVTCITHRKDAVYPATIVGIPPQEDAWIAKATERIFLSPIKMTLQPEIEDFHMPDAGVAHNLVVVKINKSYPGQGMKVLNSLAGAGQMMFSKYIVAVSGDTNIRDYSQLARHVFENTGMSRDLLFGKGPLDVLDHASDAFSFGGKLCVDATIKLPEELAGMNRSAPPPETPRSNIADQTETPFTDINLSLLNSSVPVAVLSADSQKDPDFRDNIISYLRKAGDYTNVRLFLLVDHTVDVTDLHMVVWQILGNTDPLRDHIYVSESCLLIDGTIKIFRKEGFPRRWPNVVCSDPETIASVDWMWNSLGLGSFIGSPSTVYSPLIRNARDEIIL
jgi:4-hydroxy-3-polyprenylbenzoate decarboxylase